MRRLSDFSYEENKKVNDDFSDTVIPSADKYDGLSRDQLLDALKRAVISAKRSDSYSAETIEDFCNFVTPMLDDDAKARLTEIMSVLENE